VATLESVCVERPPADQKSRLELLNTLIAGQEAARAVSSDSPGNRLGSEAFGELWKGPESEWNQLRAITAWVAIASEAKAPNNFREIMSRLDDPHKYAPLLQKVAVDFKRCLAD